MKRFNILFRFVVVFLCLILSNIRVFAYRTVETLDITPAFRFNIYQPSEGIVAVVPEDNEALRILK